MRKRLYTLHKDNEKAEMECKTTNLYEGALEKNYMANERLSTSSLLCVR
jgi:hypothetical protein